MLLPKSYNLTGGRHRVELAGGSIILALTYTDATTETEMAFAANDAKAAMNAIEEAIRSQRPRVFTAEETKTANGIFAVTARDDPGDQEEEHDQS